ncbi:unnamed protein product [Parnassius apollo]|uniref:(apollo) hypothetical protein n=1 Tax=Parnassius apollo TaxID=110799 RepID=A0A8S3XWC9_PARAO|nr:unnamed protein product [Parnassius apollo]
MILPIALIFNSFVMMTLAVQYSFDTEQQRLSPKYAEVLLTPPRFSIMKNGTSTNDKKDAKMSNTDEALNEVSDIIFNDIPQYKKVMELLLQDIKRGNHLLLVENRGLENKKVADRLLQYLNRPTEYTQLQRNTTVHSLTIHPNAKNGTVINEDSPLIKAVKYGYVLVVDEADKAPITVTSSLNSLMENGEMILSDGRKMISKKILNSSGGKPSGIIPVHEDFRMIIMASQTGFPLFEKYYSIPLGLEDKGVHNASSTLPPGNRTRHRRQTSSSTSHEIGITVKAVGSSPAITTVVMGADGMGPHTATAIASGTAVATATALTYGTGTSTATAIANVSSVATATAHSYDRAVATATASAQDSSSAEATAHAYDKAVATATANSSETKVVTAKAIAKGNQVITDTQTGPST